MATMAGSLVACVVAPPPPEGPVAGAQAVAATATTPAGSAMLQPLAPQLTVPPGALPRSKVAAVNYDLTVPGAGAWLPDDGVPGVEAAHEGIERGGASWYGIQFHQRKTASGERFDMTAMTAAHKTLPFGAHVCVTSLVNGREVMVRINDRGPYAAGRVIDLSRAAADAIGLLGLGIKQVSLSPMGVGERCGEAVNPGDDALALTALPVKNVTRSQARRARPSSVRRPKK